MYVCMYVCTVWLVCCMFECMYVYMYSFCAKCMYICIHTYTKNRIPYKNGILSIASGLMLSISECDNVWEYVCMYVCM